MPGEDFAILAGKRVGIGPRGGTTGIYMPDFFKVLKIDAALHTGRWSELAAAIEARALDALAVGAGVPFPSSRASSRSDPVLPDAHLSREWLMSDYSAAAKTLRCIRGRAIFWQLSDQQRTSQSFIPSWVGSD